MENPTITDFMEQLVQAETVRSEVRDLWKSAGHYWNNTILTERKYNPAKLLSPKVGRWGFDNTIPEAGRTFAAWVISRPFEVKVTPMGDTGDIMLATVANGLTRLLKYYKKQPEFNDLLRELSIRMKFFNYVGTCDYWCDLHDRPAIRVIPHDDLYCDPTAMALPNMPGGPWWVAVRRRLREDEARNRYGKTKLDTMRKGILGGFDSVKQEESKAYDETYEVFEWYGLDETEVTISRKETEEIVASEMANMMQTGQPQIDPDVDHRMAMEIGDKQIISRAKEVTGQDYQTIDEAAMGLTEVGYSQSVDMYMMWRQGHQQALDEDEESGTKPKYPGYVYHAEFQYGMEKMLQEPEALDFKHYEIPISIYRAHVGTEPGLVSAGPAVEFLAVQNDVEYYEKCERDLAQFYSRPSGQLDRDLLDPEIYPMAKGVLKQLIQNIRDGMAIIYTRGSQGKDVLRFTNPGTVNVEFIRRILEYKRSRIQQIIGPTKEMRGDVSGEVSGKAYGMRQEAAAMPISDTLSLLESGIQKAFNRMAMNIVQYAPIEHMMQIAGPEHVQALQALRESGMDAKFAVQVILGNYFPTDHMFLVNFGMSAMQQGFADPKEVEEKIGSPIALRPPPPPPMGGAGGGAPGQPQPGVGSPPAPVPITSGQ